MAAPEEPTAVAETVEPEDEAPPPVVLSTEREMSQRFIDGEKGDVAKAKARWQVTVDWRMKNKIDTILVDPHPNFHTMRSRLHGFYHGRSKNGVVLYFEKPKMHDLKGLKQLGFTADEIARHWVWSTEYLWTHINPDDGGSLISVLDLKGVKVHEFAGDTLELFKLTSGIGQKHYPERSCKIYVINVPHTFSAIWNVAKRLLDPVTRSKTQVIRDPKVWRPLLIKDLGAENLPVEYGGTCDCAPCHTNSPDTRAMQQYAEATLARHGVPIKAPPELTVPPPKKRLSIFGKKKMK